MKLKEILENKNDYHQIDIIVSKAMLIADRIIRDLAYLKSIQSNIDNVSNWEDLLNELDKQVSIFQKRIQEILPHLHSLEFLESAKTAIEILSSKQSEIILKRTELR